MHTSHISRLSSSAQMLRVTLCSLHNGNTRPSMPMLSESCYPSITHRGAVMGFYYFSVPIHLAKDDANQMTERLIHRPLLKQ